MSASNVVRRFRHLTYANVLSTITAVAVLTTGTAWAAATIGSGDIQSNAVKSGHIASNQVLTRHLRASAVTGAKIKNNSISGLDIQRGTIKASNLSPATLNDLRLGGRVGYALRSKLDQPWQVDMVDTNDLRVNTGCFAGSTDQPEIAPHVTLGLGSFNKKNAWMTVYYNSDDAPAGYARKQVSAADDWEPFDNRTGTGGGTFLAGIASDTLYQGTFSFQMNDAANTCDMEFAVVRIPPTFS